MGVPFLGEVPIDATLRVNGDNGHIASNFLPECPSKSAWKPFASGWRCRSPKRFSPGRRCRHLRSCDLYRSPKACLFTPSGPIVSVAPVIAVPVLRRSDVAHLGRKISEPRSFPLGLAGVCSADRLGA